MEPEKHILFKDPLNFMPTVVQAGWQRHDCETQDSRAHIILKYWSELYWPRLVSPKNDQKAVGYTQYNKEQLNMVFWRVWLEEKKKFLCALNLI